MHSHALKRALTVALIAIVLFIVIQTYRDSSYEIVNYPKEVFTVVAFGDSLVEGIGATRGNDMISLLSDEIGIQIVNLGVAGDTTSSALSRIDDVTSLEPDVTILLVGGNDYLRRVSKEETFNNIYKIIQTLQEKGSIVLVLGIKGGILKDGYKKSFDKVTRESGAAYVTNILNGIIGESEYLSDQIHPNDSGYALMADRVTPVLRSLLE